MTYPAFPLTICAALLAVAALRDLETRRIPNAVTVALLASGLGAQALVFGARAALAAAGAAALAGVVHALPWAIRAIGGGDLKLAAGAAAWVGLDALPLFLLATALLGGVLALAATANRARLLARSQRGLAGVGRATSAAFRGGAPLPYGVAIAAGALAALVWRTT